MKYHNKSIINTKQHIKFVNWGTFIPEFTVADSA